MFPILIVDDAAKDAALAERVLRACKILNPVLTFSTGEEFLRYFTTGSATPVMVLLDMVMKPLSGAEVLQAAEKLGLTGKTAFVMLSRLAEYRLLQEGYQHGARTFLLKPLKQEDVLQLLSKIPSLSVFTKEDGYILAPSTSLPAGQKALRFA